MRFLLPVVAVAFLTACGGSAAPTSSPTPSPTPSPAPTASPTPAPRYTAAEAIGAVQHAVDLLYPECTVYGTMYDARQMAASYRAGGIWNIIYNAGDGMTDRWSFDDETGQVIAVSAEWARAICAIANSIPTFPPGFGQ